MLLEQHVDLDLDGDGYAEPYIVTIEETSRSTLRIVTGFDREEDIERNRSKEVVSIRRTEYFTKYSFIPSPDGGVYDVGFGVLLGPLNESTNSLVNQLVDAGTMSVTAGGFLGRGAKMRSGVYTFAPLEWKRVDSTGDDLRKSIFPLPVREPNAVLFTLLSLLINYVERLSGTTDPMVGENPGQNTTAETMRTMVQEGQRIYAAVFKRIWRSMKEEFKKGYFLNALFMPVRKSFGQGQFALREDYLGNPDEVAPAADPNVVSEQMRMAQAVALKTAAASTPGYNLEEAERRYLKALRIEGIEAVYPGISKTGMPKDPKLAIAELNAQVDMARLQAEQGRFALEMQEQVRMNTAEIMKIAAEIQEARETLRGDVQDRQIAILNAILGMAKQRNEILLKRLDVLMKAMEVESEPAEQGNVRRLERAPGNRGVVEGIAPAEADAA
jgi:chaperonin GroES